MLLESRVEDYRAALADPIDRDYFSEAIAARSTPPTFDGVFDVGTAGGVGALQVRVVPFAFAGPGTEFFVNVIGWSRYLPNGAADRQVWLPIGLAQLYCVVGDRPGPRPSTSQGRPIAAVGPAENFCSTVQLVAGSVGYGVAAGDAVSFQPRTGLIAHAEVSVKCCSKVQFDFARLGQESCPMNALWARA